MKKHLLIIPFILLNINIALAQSLRHLWTGQRDIQTEESMPKGHAPAQKAELQKFIPSMNLFSKTDLRGDKNAWKLNNWTLIDNNSLIESQINIFSTSFEEELLKTNYANKIYNATVPGTILGTLVDRGAYPDPYFGLNNLSIPDSLARMDWWYRTTFNVNSLNEGEQIILNFEGINYRSEIYLNGKRIGLSLGAFSRTEIEISSYLNKESNENILAVHIYPPYNPGIPHEQSMVAGQGLNGGILSIDGPTFIASMGWDWIPGIRDRNTGIWQDVWVKRYKGVKIADAQIISDLALPDTSSADLYINVPIKNLSNTKKEINIKFEIRNSSFNKSITLAAQTEGIIRLSPENTPELKIASPKLWWPNGYGEANLYELNLEVSANNSSTIIDSKSFIFGIRELSYELTVADREVPRKKTPEEMGVVYKRIEFSPVNRKTKVVNFDNEKRVEYTNDKAISYSKGMYVPVIRDEEGIEYKENDSTSPFLVLKVNGKRIFCRGGNWGMDDAMKRKNDEALENAIALHAHTGFNIIRNWTGESTQENFYALCDKYGILVWNDFWITTDDTVEPMDHKLFLANARETVLRYRNHPSIVVWCPRNEGFAPSGLEEPLNNLITELDPSRHYHGQSRYLNMGASGPWGYYKDKSWYFDTRAEGFNTEMGSYAIPTAWTLKKFIAPEDQWPINDVWAYHDLHHTSQNFDDFMADVNALGAPGSLEDFSMKAQVRCYDAWRAMIEAWNNKIWDNTTGLILWMSHPAWPSMIWQTYTYDFETPGSFYGAKKASEMIHIQMAPGDRKVSIIDVDAQMNGKYRVLAEIFNADGLRLWDKKELVTMNNNYKYSLFEIPSENSLTELSDGSYFIRLKLFKTSGSNKKEALSINEYWEYKSKIERADNKNITCSYLSKSSSDLYKISVKNNSKKVISGIKLNAMNPETSEIILPAFISDSYFTLLPGETRIIYSSEKNITCLESKLCSKE